MKIIFLGTPEFSISVLNDLVNSKHEVVAVVTQTDQPVGRSGKLQFPPVKEYAIKYNIPVFQFEKIRRPESVEQLKALNADIMITAAYGQILTQAVLDITPYGVFNVHGSLLPKYRGAAPIQWAIINGETITGITIMKTNIGLDSGDTLLKHKIKIDKEDTSETLFTKMSAVAGKFLLEALDLLETKNYKLVPQNENEATKFPMLKKEDGKLHFNKTSEQLINLVRGVTPWPGAYTLYNGNLLKVHKASIYLPLNEELQAKIDACKAGEVAISSSKLGLIVKTLDGAVRLNEVQAFGGKRMSDTAFLNGNKIEEGTIFEE